jgi:hypothetical protein
MTGLGKILGRVVLLCPLSSSTCQMTSSRVAKMYAFGFAEVRIMKSTSVA